MRTKEDWKENGKERPLGFTIAHTHDEIVFLLALRYFVDLGFCFLLGRNDGLNDEILVDWGFSWLHVSLSFLLFLW
jgi:hypothetical protein